MATGVYEEKVHVRRERRPCAGPRGITLGQLLARAHEAVASGATHAQCPVCGGRLIAESLEARCDDCGSRLA